MGDNLEVSLTGQRFEATIVNRVGGGEMVSVVAGTANPATSLSMACRWPNPRSATCSPCRSPALLLHHVQSVQRRAQGPGCLRPQRDCPARGPTRYLDDLLIRDVD